VAVFGFENAFDCLTQRFYSKRLRDETKTLLDDIVAYHVAIIIAGHEQYFETGVDGAQTIDQHGATHSRHDDVREQKVGMAFETFEGFDGGVSTLRGDHLVAFFGENTLQQAQDIGLVVDDENRFSIVCNVTG